MEKLKSQEDKKANTCSLIEVSKDSKKNAEDVVCKERAKSNRYQINAIVNGGIVNVQLVAT